mmetsp:Transcript_20939/g.45806  ORF Transcript_20939/g.45806 Transcript_20939/m.45806 type:complete len:387 (-) Transcript_20939:342-1502(-)
MQVLQTLLRCSEIASSSCSSSLRGLITSVAHYETAHAASKHQGSGKSGTHHNNYAQPPSWSQSVNSAFSLRPSSLSPLHNVYQQELLRSERRQLLHNLLKAHSLLASEVDGLDDAQVASTSAYRARQLQQMSHDYRELAPKSNLAECKERALSVGFCALLEESALGRDLESEEFHDVVEGRLSPWDHWSTSFAGRYQGVPGLDSVHAIYAKRKSAGQLEHARTLVERATENLNSSSGANTSLASTSMADLSPHVDVHGVAHATGKRKTSLARVSVAPAGNQPAQITINGRPFDSYFRDLHVRAHVFEPFVISRTFKRFNVEAAVTGGGLSAQAQAVRHALAKALSMQLSAQAAVPLTKLRMMDGRQVERKKPGRKKARKGFAWVRR